MSPRGGIPPNGSPPAPPAPDSAFHSPACDWWLLRAHWAAGLLPLAFLPAVSRLALLAASTSLIVGSVLDAAGAPRRRWDRWAAALLLAAACGSAADFLTGNRDILSTFSLLVLAVQSVRFVLPKRARDGWQLCAISFAEFLTSASAATGMQFAAYLYLYLGLSAAAMWSLQSEAASEAGEFPPFRLRARTAAAVLLLSAAAGFLCTVLLFAVTPRVGFGRLARRFGRPATLTGFSGTISLRDVTAVKMDRTIVARVEFPTLDPRLSPQALYLRGATFADLMEAQWAGTSIALTEAGRPNMTISLARLDAPTMGALRRRPSRA